MKKHLIRNGILMAVVTLIMGIVLSLYLSSTGTVPAADNAATYSDGTYTASAQGYKSEVTVMINITGGKVTNVQIDAADETPEVGGKAAESLSMSLLDAGGTAGVDAVTGATMTSNAVFTAMDDCLAQAAQ